MIKRLSRIPINIITYSKVNLDIAKKKLGATRKYFLLPINYFNFPDNKFNKNIDLVIYHRDLSGYSKNRRIGYNSSIIDSNDSRLNKYILFNHWDDERTELFNKTKIFVNLHRTKNKLKF